MVHSPIAGRIRDKEQSKKKNGFGGKCRGNSPFAPTREMANKNGYFKTRK